MRIIHISDLHFGMHQPELIQPFLNDINLLKPDVILISGDLTQRATQQQYLLFQEFMHKLPGKILTVPGNHDIPLHNLLSRLTRPFKLYNQYVSPSLEASFTNKEVNILGVNSATPYKIKEGVLSTATLTRIKNHFSEHSTQLNILFFHHNLNYFSKMHHPLTNAEEFIAYLKTSPIHIVCTGHLHYATLKLIDKKRSGQCAILHAGSLFCERSKDKMNSFYVIDTNHLNCTVDWRVFDDNSFVSHQKHKLNLQKS